MDNPEPSHIVVIQQLNKQINVVLKEYETALLTGERFSALNEIKNRLTDLKKKRGEAYSAAKVSAAANTK
jgi:hypothetical protein